MDVSNADSRYDAEARIGIVCYDAASSIVGGTTIYSDALPRNGATVVEQPVLVTRPPARCEAYTET